MFTVKKKKKERKGEEGLMNVQIDLKQHKSLNFSGLFVPCVS